MEVFLRHAEGSGALPAEGKPLNYISQQPSGLFLTVCAPDQFDRNRITHLGQTEMICFLILTTFSLCRTEMFQSDTISAAMF